MSYNTTEFPQYVKTAGKVTVLTAVAGLLVFMFAFMFDAGTQELKKVSAQQSATTTLTVLNTPPEFAVLPYEVFESSTTSPTNSGTSIQWSAVAADANGSDYYLLVCSGNATPTPHVTNAPACHASTVQWGVSTSTISGQTAVVSTTTTEVAPFAEVNNWYAWVCDNDITNPRCSVTPEQGDYATSSSPFHVNKRPVLTNFYNNGPINPGELVTFLSTSSDTDTVGGDQNVFLVVCSTNSGIDPITRTCVDSSDIASTSPGVTADATATYQLPLVIRDDTYAAYGYLVDQYAHVALANPISADFAVNNVAPVVWGGDIDLNNGANMVLSTPAGETTGFTLDFRITDANSCLNAASSSELVGYTVALHRSTVSNCDGTGDNYNPNQCYDNAVPTSVWNIGCSATTTCASPLQDYMDYTCTFPLWFITDPTDALSPYNAENWQASIAGVDDNNATGTAATTTNPVEVVSFTALDILASEIAYGSIEPGSDTGTLSATSTALNVGNTGLNQDISGDSMCGTYSVGNPCEVSATSTIQEDQQKFSSTTLSYASPLALSLSSTTPQELVINIPKTTSTSTLQEGDTYWGIAVPLSVTLAGSYQGMNTFQAVASNPANW